MSNRKNIIVIGCTHAGTAAVKNILKLHSDVNVTVYERNDNISFLSCGIALYIGGVVKDPQGLFYSNPKELKSMGASVKMRHDVININSLAKTVTIKDLSTGKVFFEKYDKLVITTGSWPIIPKVVGIQQSNILLCKNFNQAKEIIQKSVEAKKIAIIGGGYIGIELVEAFVESKKEVVLIDSCKRVLSKYLDKPMTDILEEKILQKGVKLALNQSLVEFKGNSGKVTSVVTTSGEHPADLVILCVGFAPYTSLLAGQVEMLSNGAIVIDPYMRTSCPDIFAAGDCATVHYNPTGLNEYIPLATNAVRQGLLVAYNLKENKVAYRGTQGTSGLHLFGYNIGSTGLTEEVAKSLGVLVRSVLVEDNYRPEFMPSTEKIQMKLVYESKTKRIMGGQLLSKYDITQSINTLSLAVQNRMTIEDLALSDFFFQPHFDRPWNYLNILALAAMDQDHLLQKKQMNLLKPIAF